MGGSDVVPLEICLSSSTSMALSEANRSFLVVSSSFFFGDNFSSLKCKNDIVDLWFPFFSHFHFSRKTKIFKSFFAKNEKETKKISPKKSPKINDPDYFVAEKFQFLASKKLTP